MVVNGLAVLAGLCSNDAAAGGTNSRGKLTSRCPMNDAWGEARLLLSWKLHHSIRWGMSSLRSGSELMGALVSCRGGCRRGCFRVSECVFEAVAAVARCHHCKGRSALDGG